MFFKSIQKNEKKSVGKINNTNLDIKLLNFDLYSKMFDSISLINFSLKLGK